MNTNPEPTQEEQVSKTGSGNVVLALSKRNTQIQL